MPRHLKTGRTPEQTSAEAKKVRDIVTGIIEDIESRGETALRDISEKFASTARACACLRAFWPTLSRPTYEYAATVAVTSVTPERLSLSHGDPGHPRQR